MQLNDGEVFRQGSPLSLQLPSGVCRSQGLPAVTARDDVMVMFAGKAVRYLCSSDEECADHMACQLSLGRYVCACVDDYVAKLDGSCGMGNPFLHF